MPQEQTLSLIKPSSVIANQIGGIINKFEKGGLKVVAAKMLHLTENQAKDFYGVHQGKPFFNELINFMTTGPILAQVLEGENAIQKNRDIMGATNPAEAAPGTIRAEFAHSMTENAVHGSDASDTAEKEIAFFFDKKDIYSNI
jgi:nucleoside-diphosphate kinase